MKLPAKRYGRALARPAVGYVWNSGNRRSMIYYKNSRERLWLKNQFLQTSKRNPWERRSRSEDFISEHLSWKTYFPTYGGRTKIIQFIIGPGESEMWRERQGKKRKEGERKREKEKKKDSKGEQRGRRQRKDSSRNQREELGSKISRNIYIKGVR